MSRTRWVLGIFGGAVGVAGAVVGAMQVSGARSNRVFLDGFGTDLRALGTWYNSRLNVVGQQEAVEGQYVEAILGMPLNGFSVDAAGHICDVEAAWTHGQPFNQLTVTVNSGNPVTLNLLADTLKADKVKGVDVRNVRHSYRGGTVPVIFTLVTQPNDHRDVVAAQAKWRDSGH